MQVYKFNTMFRGQAVVIEYAYADVGETELDYAVINRDNKSFVHPDYENFTNYLDRFHEEVYLLTLNHLLKIKKAKNEKV